MASGSRGKIVASDELCPSRDVLHCSHVRPAESTDLSLTRGVLRASGEFVQRLAPGEYARWQL